ncbi:MAG: hypothetical protein SO251_01970 [Candidatus Fimisoma sp.]|nr:hypothetical protein [Candidatus Fimisoma sp.]
MCNIPQDFADKKIGSCPFCGEEHPRWLVKEEWKVIGSNNYYFKCPECESELMVPKDDVTGMSFTKNTYSGKQKMKAGKIMNMPYVTIIKIGLSAKTSENMLLKDEEIPLDQLKKVCRKE